ncbi:hypothetical protein KsCSTR_48260 [Candidatus Kuenenia stuttgartiensis]|jgi:hypothetical protein|uniref:Uncharacterized protein n=1 Tax=Kuenenia stuttgartiensis TaxID=174633 RepID=A0A6G7GY10_KUEST|nr:hypothetical protein KsCSTR_48260 [Candidatus Kuenenia stuttgartiensis]
MFIEYLLQKMSSKSKVITYGVLTFKDKGKIAYLLYSCDINDFLNSTDIA